MSALTEFRKRLDDALSARGVSVRTWSAGGSYSRNLMELSTSPKLTVLYVKEFNVPGRPGFWGLTRNQVNRLERSAARWLVVLLLRSSTTGYVLAATQVLQLIADGSFELSGDGDFKVNEDLDLIPEQRFQSLTELLNRIL
jgi:hypothetical protein